MLQPMTDPLPFTAKTDVEIKPTLLAENLPHLLTLARVHGILESLVERPADCPIQPRELDRAFELLDSVLNPFSGGNVVIADTPLAVRRRRN